jgi:RHS repeat-associated protein
VDLVTLGSHQTDYVYDRDRLWKRTDAAGATIHGYDSAGRLSSVTDPFTAQATSITYTSAGRPDTRTDPTGLFHDYGYDQAGRLTSEVVTQASTEVARFTSAYDPETNVTSRTRIVLNGPENGTWSYGYDDAGRLISATPPIGSAMAYGYDGAGNRTRVQVGTDTAVTTAYDRAGRPTSSSDGTTYGHDPSGNLTSITGGPNGTWSYAYDPFDRMTGASKAGGASLGVLHDALDRAVQRTKQGALTTTYAWAGAGEELVSESDGSQATLYVYAAGEPLARKREGVTRFYGLSPHGDVTYLASTTGTPVGWRAYGPWGDVRQATGEGQGSTLGFQSDITDPDTLLVDMGVRLYAPTLGRFTTPDLLRGEAPEPLSMNRFLYAEADPISMIDPTGLRPLYCDGPGGICGGSSGSISTHRRGIRTYSAQAYVATQAYEASWGGRISSSVGRTVASWLVNYEKRPDRTTSRRIGKPSWRDYATGRALPPYWFPYQPDIRRTKAGVRAADPYGDGCSKFPDRSWGDFTDACLTHDYLYDLRRVGLISRHDVARADRLLQQDAMADCRTRVFVAQCNRTAGLMYEGLRLVFPAPRRGEPVGVGLQEFLPNLRLWSSLGRRQPWRGWLWP